MAGFRCYETPLKRGPSSMRHASAIAVCAFLFCFALAAGPARAQSFPERGRAAVVDAAGVIPDEAEAALDARIVAWNRRTGHQLAVATVPDLEGRTIREYAVGLLRHWGLGGAQSNDGVLVLLAPAEREVRVEVGYGLESVLTDLEASRIIRETIRPALASDEIAQGLDAGVGRIMATIAPSAPPAPPPPSVASEPQDMSGVGLMIGFLISGLIVGGIIWLVVRAARGDEQDAVARTAEPKQERGKRRRSKAGASPAAADAPDALEALAERPWQYEQNSGSYDSGGGSDSGFDSGGGSGGGGGADDRY
jgi:uncharacterized protein